MDRQCVIRNAQLWDGRRLVRFTLAYGTIGEYLAHGYAATVTVRGFRGRFVIPTKRLELR